MVLSNEFKNNVTLLLTSCDSYEDLWDNFFKLLTINWPNFDLNVVLNTESKEYSYPGVNITTYQLDKKHKWQWSKRLRKNLEKISTKYILFFLEDFYLISFLLA